MSVPIENAADPHPTAIDYVREQSIVMSERYSGDCVQHAARIASMLIAEGREAWIGRIGDVSARGEALFHAPLIPSRYAGRGALAWNTHYVACCGGEVYDPLAGAPVDCDAYGETVFGRKLQIEEFLDPVRTRSVLAGAEDALNREIRLRIGR